MFKHDNENYWECSCRKYGDKPTDLFYPDDSCEPLHYKHVKLINDIQQVIKYVEGVEHEADTVDYIIDMLKRSLNEAGV